MLKKDLIIQNNNFNKSVRFTVSMKIFMFDTQQMYFVMFSYNFEFLN